LIALEARCILQIHPDNPPVHQIFLYLTYTGILKGLKTLLFSKARHLLRVTLTSSTGF
jgi:hypothetical protein